MRFVNSVKEKEDVLYTREEAAKYLRLQYKTLEKWAWSKKYDLFYIKVGGRAMYRKTDLDQFLCKRTVRYINQ